MQPASLLPMIPNGCLSQIWGSSYPLVLPTARRVHSVYVLVGQLELIHPPEVFDEGDNDLGSFPIGLADCVGGCDHALGDARNVARTLCLGILDNLETLKGVRIQYRKVNVQCIFIALDRYTSQAECRKPEGGGWPGSGSPSPRRQRYG